VFCEGTSAQAVDRHLESVIGCSCSGGANASHPGSRPRRTRRRRGSLLGVPLVEPAVEQRRSPPPRRIRRRQQMSLATASTGARWRPVRRAWPPHTQRARATAPPTAPPAPEITVTFVPQHLRFLSVGGCSHPPRLFVCQRVIGPDLEPHDNSHCLLLLSRGLTCPQTCERLRHSSLSAGCGSVTAHLLGGPGCPPDGGRASGLFGTPALSDAG
jgi:hypothetical protein